MYDGDMGDDVWLVYEGADVLAVGRGVRRRGRGEREETDPWM